MTDVTPTPAELGQVGAVARGMARRWRDDLIEWGHVPDDRFEAPARIASDDTPRPRRTMVEVWPETTTGPGPMG